MTDIKPCTVKGCRETVIHHHDDPAAPHPKAWPCSVSGCDFPYGREGQFGPAVAPAPRQTRKALNARIAELEAENADLIERGWADEKAICDLRAENADLFAEIADKKDRLARCELPADVTWSALNVSADGKTIGFVLAARHHFIGFNYNIENSAAGFTTSLADAVQHVRQTYLAAVEAGEVAVA